MASRRREDNPVPKRGKPATTPEAREYDLINLAQGLAEEQIRTGQASSQVITHFLKLGSSRERLEQQRLEYENQLTQVKMESMARAEATEDMYKDALRAMSTYQGNEVEDEFEDED